MGVETETTYDFKSGKDASGALDSLVSKVRGLNVQTPGSSARVSTCTGSRVEVFISGRQIVVRQELGPGITTPSKIITDARTRIEEVLASLTVQTQNFD